MSVRRFPCPPGKSPTRTPPLAGEIRSASFQSIQMEFVSIGEPHLTCRLIFCKLPQVNQQEGTNGSKVGLDKSGFPTGDNKCVVNPTGYLLGWLAALQFTFNP